MRRTASRAALSHFITTDCSASPPTEVGESQALSAINAAQTEATRAHERQAELDGTLNVIDLKNAPRFALSSGGRKCHRTGSGGRSRHGLDSGAGPEFPRPRCSYAVRIGPRGCWFADCTITTRNRVRDHYAVEKVLPCVQHICAERIGQLGSRRTVLTIPQVDNDAGGRRLLLVYRTA